MANTKATGPAAPMAEKVRLYTTAYQAFTAAGDDGLSIGELTARLGGGRAARLNAGRAIRALIDEHGIEQIVHGRWKAIPGWTQVLDRNRYKGPLVDKLPEPVIGVDVTEAEYRRHRAVRGRKAAARPRTVEIDEDLVALMTVEEQRQYRLYQAVNHEDDWLVWIPSMFPAFASKPFGPHHEQFWEHVWSIEDGVGAAPHIDVWSRGHGKSSSLEMAVVALAARRRRHYTLYVCHESGTWINDMDLGWMKVDDHPTAQRRNGGGFQVTITGLPSVTPEVVTPEHRYWARRISTRAGHDGRTHYRTDAGWIEARMLDWNTWIGLPIDTSVKHVKIELTDWNRSVQAYLPGERSWQDDPEWWWVVGLWWGDGTLGGARKSQISWAMADAHPEVLSRLTNILRRHGYDPKFFRPKSGAALVHVSICDSALARWLATWKKGRSRKEPPEWVESLPLVEQRHLLTGYLAADGHATDRGVSLVSIHLPGLLVVRRIALRLGIISLICQTRTARPIGASGTFVNPNTGTQYPTAACYRLDMRQGASMLGYAETPREHELVDIFIEDGHLWSRVKTISPVEDRTFVAITTSTHDYTTAFGRSHNCETQDQADEHVSSIATLLQSEMVHLAYPDVANPELGKHGSPREWRRNRLRTASGFTVDALGLDVAARGKRIDEHRPDLLIFDDIDNDKDTPATVKKKIRAVTRKILPTRSQDACTLGAQNRVHGNGIFARLAATGGADDPEPADFLANRVVVGPVPAIWRLSYEQRALQGGRFRHVITGGEPSWEGMPLESCQDAMDEVGLDAFLAEYQHEEADLTGSMFGHLDFTSQGPIRVPESAVPKFTHTCVWVDPAVSKTDRSDSCGIVVDSLGVDKLYYRRWAWERIASADEVLEVAVRAALDFGAEVLGVETDQGGGTWEVIFRQVLANVVEEICGENGGDLPEGMRIPRFESAKAASSDMSKIQRIQRMASEYNLGRFRHVEGHVVALERGLRRFPEHKPYDVVDAGWYSWRWLATRGGDPGSRNRMKMRAPRGAVSDVSAGGLR